MTKIPNYSLSYVSRASGYENIPRLNTAAQPVGGISNSAYLGHLIHEPHKLSPIIPSPGFFISPSVHPTISMHYSNYQN